LSKENERGPKTISYTIVAFRYDQSNSLLYRKSKIPTEIQSLVWKALVELQCDVISIRRVFESGSML